MRSKKNIMLGLLFLLGIFVSANYVFASPTPPVANLTLNVPAVDGIINSSTFIANCSIDGYLVENWTRAHFYIYSAGLTANTSQVSAGSAINVTGGEVVDFLITIANATLYEDANDYIALCSFSNATETANSTARTGLTFNTTNPTIPSAISPTGVVTTNSLALTSTVVGGDTTACTVEFIGILPPIGGGAGNIRNMTHSGNVCSLTISSVADQTYRYQVTASDGTESAVSATQTANVDVQTSAGKQAILNAQQQQLAAQSLFSPITDRIGSGPMTAIVVIVILGFVFRKRLFGKS